MFTIDFIILLFETIRSLLLSLRQIKQYIYDRNTNNSFAPYMISTKAIEITNLEKIKDNMLFLQSNIIFIMILLSSSRAYKTISGRNNLTLL